MPDSCPGKTLQSHLWKRACTLRGQGAGVDFGFMAQVSPKGKPCASHLQGLRAEACHCLIVDCCSGHLCVSVLALRLCHLTYFLSCWLPHRGAPKGAPGKRARAWALVVTWASVMQLLSFSRMLVAPTS